ncbi:MAG: hypothetical protein GVY27_04225, partial [Deinococcus-Thermus bacterium]|nr:hypothetical protein [Deinococcota bacterium]
MCRRLFLRGGFLLGPRLFLLFECLPLLFDFLPLLRNFFTALLDNALEKVDELP